MNKNIDAPKFNGAKKKFINKIRIFQIFSWSVLDFYFKNHLEWLNKLIAKN